MALKSVDAGDTWYAVIERATGRLVSVGTVLAEELADGLEAIELPGPPEGEWDAASRSFVPRAEAPDELDELVEKARAVALGADAFGPDERDKILAVLVLRLGAVG